MKNLFVESGKDTQGNVTIFGIFDFLNWVLHIQGLIILLFILLCIFKILHNLKVYTCGRFEERFKKSQSKIRNQFKRQQLAIIKIGVSINETS